MNKNFCLFKCPLSTLFISGRVMGTFSTFFFSIFFFKDSFSPTGKGLIAIHTALKLRIYLVHRDSFLYFPQFSLAPGEEKK